MYCRYCGAENSDSARFCVHCGKPLAGAAQPVEPDKHAQEGAGPAVDLGKPVAGEAVDRRKAEHPSPTGTVNLKKLEQPSVAGATHIETPEQPGSASGVNLKNAESGPPGTVHLETPERPDRTGAVNLETPGQQEAWPQRPPQGTLGQDMGPQQGQPGGSVRTDQWNNVSQGGQQIWSQGGPGVPPWQGGPALEPQWGPQQEPWGRPEPRGLQYEQRGQGSQNERADNPKPKRKVGLWILLGVVAAVSVLVTFFVMSGQRSIQQTVSQYLNASAAGNFRQLEGAYPPGLSEYLCQLWNCSEEELWNFRSYTGEEVRSSVSGHLSANYPLRIDVEATTEEMVSQEAFDEIRREYAAGPGLDVNDACTAIITATLGGARAEIPLRMVRIGAQWYLDPLDGDIGMLDLQRTFFPS